MLVTTNIYYVAADGRILTRRRRGSGGQLSVNGALTDLLAEIAPTAAALQALLVDNPGSFYGFENP